MKSFIQYTLLLMFILVCLLAQSKPKHNYKHKADSYRGLYIGSQASTNGWGFDARYALNDWFALKSGYESLNFSYDFNFDEYGINYDANMDFKTGGILLLADFSYAKNLYISAGVILNSFNPDVSGFAVSDYQYGDIIIKAEDIGTFNIEAESQLKTSPYLSAGYQKYLGKQERIVFNFETGIYYMGPPDLNIEADGLLAPTADPAMGQDEYLEYQFDAYKIYPVIKMNLAIKLF